MKEDIEIFILCRDRPEYSKLAINSVINNSLKANIIISDNSESEIIHEMYLKFFPDITYIRRLNLDPISHLKAIVQDAKAEYLVMFHDDDIMKCNYLEVMLQTFKLKKDLIAIGSNAQIINDNGNITGCFLTNNTNIEISNKNQLLLPYLTLGRGFDEIAPFPSYMYKTRYISSDMFDVSHGHNHADLSFLLKILEKGKIYWINESLIQYRIHKNNGSKIIPIVQKISLYNYLRQKENLSKQSSEMLDFRFRIWFPWLKFRLKKNLKLSRIDSIVLKFITCHFLRLLFVRPLVLLMHLKRIFF